MQLFGCADCLHPFIWSLVSGLMQFLTPVEKVKHVSVCEELHQITSADAASMSRVVTGDESWIYGYDPETKQQPSQLKGPTQDTKKRETSDIKGIVHKEFGLAGQTVNCGYCCDSLL
jgi:hypothetical protein